MPSLAPKTALSSLKADLSTAQEKIQSFTARVTHLEDMLADSDRRTQGLDRVILGQKDTIKQLQTKNSSIFERRNVEHMTRQQLVSLAEETINEARRKGMVEAEGLMSRHVTLSNETDIELMKGLVRGYQDRIAALERQNKEAAERAKTSVRLDARPLKSRLSDPPTSSVSWASRSGWWKMEKEETEFRAFDFRASAVAAEAKAKEPKTLKDGEKVHVPGDGAYMYDIARSGDVVSCTCASWTHQKTSNNRRTCKHLRRYLGEAQETARINEPQPRCWCGIETIRGQCQLHTRDWKGDEMCDCGRKFASCKSAYDTISVAQRKYGHQPRVSLSNVTGVRF